MFKYILFILGLAARPAVALDFLDLNGAWTLRAVSCLNPASGETLVGDTMDTWKFDGSIYETHIDGSLKGEFPACADLYSRGHYLGSVEGSTFHIDFIPDRENTCRRPVPAIGPSTLLENGVNLPGETFLLQDVDGELRLIEEFDSSNSCHRQRRIYAPAPLS